MTPRPVVKQYRVAVIAEKVMPYRCALYRKLAEHPRIVLKVFFLDRWGAEERFDPTMGVKYGWGKEVLRGIPHEFIENRGQFQVTYTGADRTNLERRLGVFGGLLYYLRTYFGVVSPGLVKRVGSGEFDVVIAENYSSISSVLGAITARLTGKTVFLRGEANLRGDVPILMRIFKLIYLRLVFRLYNGFMYSCRANKEYYLHYGAKESSLTFVPSAVDESLFASKPNGAAIRQSVRAALDVMDSDVVIIGVGRLVPRKNWHEALQGYARALKKNNKIRFILVGDGPERRALEALAVSLNCPVNFVGFKSQEEITRYYHAADILVQTSTYDPSPKVMNEALGFGLPMIVSTAVGTAKEVCVQGENGIVYEAGDLSSLETAICALAESKALRVRFGNMSRRLSERWSIQAGVDNIVIALSEG